MLTKWECFWKKFNVVTIHKKGGKQFLKNYCTVSLLPVFSKIFKRIVFNPMLEFLEKNNLLILRVTGFCSSDSFHSQLLSIVYDIYASFNQIPTFEVRPKILDISKAVDKVLFKLGHIKISSNLLSLLKAS